MRLFNGKLQRMIACICAVSTLLACFSGSMTAFAQSSTVLSASPHTVEKDDTVSVAVTLNGNTGVWAIKVKVGYDHSALSLQSASNGIVFGEDDAILPENLSKEQFVYIANATYMENITTSGDLFTLSFKVLESAAISTYPITVSLTQAIDVNGSDVTMDINNGSVKVVNCLHSGTLSKTEAKSATCIATGNIEYWYCSKCKCYYYDGKAENEITKEQTIISENKNNHIGSTYIKDQKDPSCIDLGYSGDVFCNSCHEVIQKGTEIQKKDHITPSAWTTDENNHWHICTTVGCGYIMDKEAHKGGEASCISKAVCFVCNVPYGSIDSNNHKHTRFINVKAATEDDKGYTGDTYCDDCQKTVSYGKETDKLPHTHNLTHISSKASTCIAKGNIEYWYCTKCLNYYSDAYASNEVTENQTVISENAANHVGGTYIDGQKEASCFKLGYTGDTHCKSCNAILVSGTDIQKKSHVSASTWKTDENNHWHECITVGCENIMDKEAHKGGEATCKFKATCSVCGVEYGKVNSSNHKHTEVRDVIDSTCTKEGYTGDTYCIDCGDKIANGTIISIIAHNLEKIDEKPSTASTNGNITYYHCKDCGNCFSDEKAKFSIEEKDTVIEKTAPSIIEGKNVKYNVSSNKGLAVRSDASIEDFIRVEVDGKEVEKSNYTVKSGSIIVNFTPEYLSTLSNGIHKISIVSISGSAETTVEIIKGNENTSPQTGDSSNIAIWIVLAFISIGGFFITLSVKKRRSH